MEKTPTVASSALIKRNGEILLVKRRYSPSAGRWALPGGIVEYGETVEKAALREVKEETNADVEVKKLLGVYNLILKNENGKIENHYTIVCFECIYKESTLKPSYEIEELGWFKLENIKNLHLVSTTKMALKDAGMM